MSEFDRPREYLRVMADPFVEGLSKIEKGSTPDDSWTNGLITVQDVLKRVDWKNSCLEPVWVTDTKGEKVKLSPEGYSLKLATAAFDDAQKLLRQCEKKFEAIGADHTVYAPVLHRSKSNILIAARLSDKDKLTFLQSLKYPEDVRKLLENMPQFSGDGLQLKSDRQGYAVLNWNPDIDSWIRDRIYSKSGCPAYYKAVETPQGRRPNLVHHFWDTLVDKMYGS